MIAWIVATAYFSHGLEAIHYTFISEFGDSPYQVIEAIYPGHFKPWEFSNVPMNYWKDPENIKQALDWFLFRICGFFSYQDALNRLGQKHFFQYRMTGFYQMAFEQRLFKVKHWITELRDQHESIEKMDTMVSGLKKYRMG